jgi:ABC-type uncharacterized transport system substrate-binding protein
VAVIVTTDVPSTFAAKAATKTILVVFSIGADPVKVGLVESFSRPNGNLTGISIFLTILGPKHVELLRELLPAVNTIAVLGNPGNANFQSDVPDIRAAADALGERLEVLTASTESGDRQLESYVEKSLKGAKPADLPIQPSTKVELVINLKTAKVLGHTSNAARSRRRCDRMISPMTALGQKKTFDQFHSITSQIT